MNSLTIRILIGYVLVFSTIISAEEQVFIPSPAQQISNQQLEELTSGWFFDANDNDIEEFNLNSRVNNSNETKVDLHTGFQFNKNVKLTLGYRDFISSTQSSSICDKTFSSLEQCKKLDSNPYRDTNEISIKIRGQWALEKNLLFYAYVGGNSRNKSHSVLASQTDIPKEHYSPEGFNWDVGVSYNKGQHEVTVGYSSFVFDDKTDLALKYNYHF